MREDLRDAVARSLGSPIQGARGICGGDINEAYSIELADGRSLFLKAHPGAPEHMFATEAKGLRWLAEAAALRVPEVIVHDRSFLVLEKLASAQPCRDFGERLGRGLAALHRFGAEQFGLDHDNFIGSLAQDNRTCPDWPMFYVTRRLEPQLRLAQERNLASARMREGFPRVFERMYELAGTPEPPARLHGDLWGGNLHVDERGQPCLIDPAVYGGHREVDLAMMRLFGGFSPRCFAAYAEAYPLSDGHPRRVALYQLYPLMVHVNLFGGTYVGQVERVLRQLG
ncbi:MAG: fructosamine kinase family protein [Proteobacteria bacterium]|nr:fructosamine kinase family protein [Pseudomonadota bacterium]